MTKTAGALTLVSRFPASVVTSCVTLTSGPNKEAPN